MFLLRLEEVATFLLEEVVALFLDVLATIALAVFFFFFCAVVATFFLLLLLPFIAVVVIVFLVFDWLAQFEKDNKQNTNNKEPKSLDIYIFLSF